MTRKFGGLFTGKEAKRLHFITPIIVHISCLFEDFEILVEESVFGNSLHPHGHFEFILQRGEKKVCIIEAKKENMNQCVAQDLLGCDALADVQQSSSIYGIITNFLEWIFIRSLDDKIQEGHVYLTMRDEVVDKAGLKKITGKVYGLLSD